MRLAREFVSAKVIFLVVRRRGCVVSMCSLRVKFCSSLVHLVRIRICFTHGGSLLEDWMPSMDKGKFSGSYRPIHPPSTVITVPVT